MAAVLRAALESSHPSLPTQHWRILRALLACRTPALGGHRYRCQECGQTHFVPHSCRNRHCPLCQGQAARQWLEQQQEALLPVPYFHVVFTLPHVLNPLIRQNQQALYTLLFQAASQTVLLFGQNRWGVQLGLTAVLHTWSQTLLDHYHLHCIVTGGGLASDNSRWVSAPDYDLFPVRALAKVVRGKFLSGLEKLYAGRKLEFHNQRRGNVEGAIEALETSIDEHVMELTHYFEVDPAPMGGPASFRKSCHRTIKNVQAYRTKYPRKTESDFDGLIVRELSELSSKLQQ